MPDPVDPGQQDPSPVQHSPADPSSPPIDWEARYKGSVAKIQQLTTQLQTLTQQQALLTSEREQLQTQLGIKDTEKDVAVAERQKQINDLVTQSSEKDKELGELRAMRLKLDVITELKAPELVTIMHTVPNLTDKEAMTAAFKAINEYGSGLVKAREKQLLAGVTPPPGGGSDNAPALPTTHDGWVERINSLQMGTQERADAMNAYFDWGQAHGGQ